MISTLLVQPRGQHVARHAARCVVARYAGGAGAGTSSSLLEAAAARHQRLAFRPLHGGTPALDEHDDGTGVWTPKANLKYNIPQRIRQKVVSATDAVSLVRNGDTVCASGFVSQGRKGPSCCRGALVLFLLSSVHSFPVNSATNGHKL